MCKWEIWVVLVQAECLIVNHILSICVRVQSNESLPQVSVCVYRSPVISAVMADRSASSVKMFLMPSCCRVSLRSIFCSTLNLNISERSVIVYRFTWIESKWKHCVSPGQVDLHLLPLDVVGPLLQQLCFNDGLQGGQRNLLTGQNHHHAHVFTFIEHLQHLVHSTRLCGAIAELSWGWRTSRGYCVFQRMERTSVTWGGSVWFSFIFLWVFVKFEFDLFVYFLF